MQYMFVISISMVMMIREGWRLKRPLMEIMGEKKRLRNIEFRGNKLEAKRSGGRNRL